MLSHLKAGEFVNLVEGGKLSSKHRAHLEACARCRATWESMRSIHTEVAALEADIPEPDWSQFRSSVRDELLSRSIQRQTAVPRVMRRWTGLPMRPAVAWALSLVMAVGITTITFLWTGEGHEQTPAPADPTVSAVEPAAVEPLADPLAEAINVGPERSLFQDVVSLGAEEQEQLRQLLEAGEAETTYQQ